MTDPRRGLRGKGTESSLLLGADCAWTRVTVALMIPNCRALLTWLFCECSDGFSLFSPGRPWPAPQQLCPRRPAHLAYSSPKEVPSSSSLWLSASSPCSSFSQGPHSSSDMLKAPARVALFKAFWRETYTGSLERRAAHGQALKAG